MLCQIFSVPANGTEFQWKWRFEDGKRESASAFAFFYECVEDARKNGATVDLAGARRVDVGASCVRIVNA
jgi:hypothetical protein